MNAWSLRRPSGISSLVEDLEEYRPGGLHPVAIADTFAGGGYHVPHKLGFGGTSTIWLACDRQLSTGGLMTLKVMRAEQSAKARDEIVELTIPQKLHDILRANDPMALPQRHRSWKTILCIRGRTGLTCVLSLSSLDPACTPCLTVRGGCREADDFSVTNDLCRCLRHRASVNFTVKLNGTLSRSGIFLLIFSNNSSLDLNLALECWLR